MLDKGLKNMLNKNFDAIIEMPQGQLPIKYEIEKESDTLRVDRIIAGSFLLPFNYGYLPNTLAGDGDPIDVLVLTPNHSLYPKSVISVRPIGVLIMTDENGEDVKVLTVPTTEVTPYYKDVKHLDDIPQTIRDTIEHYFTHYKDLEDNKWSSVKGWQGKLRAMQYIAESIDNFERSK